MGENDSPDNPPTAEIPYWQRNGRKTQERESQEREALDAVQEQFKKNGVLDILRNMATILERHGHTAYPSIEMAIDPDLHHHGRAVFRAHPRPIDGLNPETTTSPYPWKSRGVMVGEDKGDLSVFYMAEGTGHGSDRVPGGWRNLEDNPGYKDFVKLRERDFDLDDKIYCAFSLSTSSFDFRTGRSVDALQGSSEKGAVSRNVAYES